MHQQRVNGAHESVSADQTGCAAGLNRENDRRQEVEDQSSELSPLMSMTMRPGSSRV